MVLKFLQHLLKAYIAHLLESNIGMPRVKKNNDEAILNLVFIAKSHQESFVIYGGNKTKMDFFRQKAELITGESLQANSSPDRTIHLIKLSSEQRDKIIKYVKDKKINADVNDFLESAYTQKTSADNLYCLNVFDKKFAKNLISQLRDKNVSFANDSDKNLFLSSTELSEKIFNNPLGDYKVYKDPDERVVIRLNSFAYNNLKSNYLNRE